MTPAPASATALSRVLRHHRIIWWVLGVSLFLAWMGSLPARSAFSGILDHSLAAGRLVHGFDLSAFAELTGSGDIPMGALVAASTAQFFVFLVYLLFLAGGINQAYLSERPLATGVFFQACGTYFWRMVRLTLTSMIPFGLLGGALALLMKMVDRWAELPSERAGDYGLLVGLAVLGLLLLWVRAWFDLAQARTVAREERGMFKTALRTFRWVSFRLYATYVGIALVRLALVAGGVWLWMRLAPEATLKSFLVLEILVFVQIVTRLWQRAASVRACQAMALPEALPADDARQGTAGAGIEPLDHTTAFEG
ncbi:MAG TPA: hypothetical protein VJ486_10855 [Geothrix sp.]|nr:hypothetical protein [Geothrix sp.]